MSKAEILRGFVTDRLAAVSREIVAAVERLVSGYEEEIDRQKKQLELLLQPRVRLDKPGVTCSSGIGCVEEDEDEDEDQTGSRCQSDQRKSSRPQISETQNHVDLRIRILEDPQTELLSKNVLQKSPVLKLKCPRGLPEPDFLDLLRSSVPQLAADERRFEVLASTRRRRLRRLKLKTVTAEEIQRTMSGSFTTTVFVRLKEQKNEDVRRQRTRNDVEDVTTFDETMTQTSVQEVEGRDVDDQQQQDVETEEDEDDEDVLVSRPAEGAVVHSATESKDTSDDDDEEKDSNNDWKPDDCDLKSKTTKKQNVVLSCVDCKTPQESQVALVKHAWSHVEDPGSVCGVCGERPESTEALKDHLRVRHKTELEEKPRRRDGREAFDRKQLNVHRRSHVGKKTHLCGVCGKSLSDYRSLSRHKMTHSGERPHSCRVCGRSFKLPGTLRQHEKIHTDRERSYLCDVCCKMFLTSKQLQIHMRTHTNEKPFHCGECGKGFTTKGPLTIHMRVHTGEAPYRCPDCGWSFKRKSNLDNHVTVHSGAKPFICGICGKACARKTHLTVHMRTHNGERPYKCSLCDKAFTQSHCLKTHMKSHLVADAAT